MSFDFSDDGNWLASGDPFSLWFVADWFEDQDLDSQNSSVILPSSLSS